MHAWVNVSVEFVATMNDDIAIAFCIQKMCDFTSVLFDPAPSGGEGWDVSMFVTCCVIARIGCSMIRQPTLFSQSVAIFGKLTFAIK